MLSYLASYVGGQAQSLASSKVVDELCSAILDERAFKFARERLREQYAADLEPLDYELFCDQLRIRSSDIKDFLLQKPSVPTDIHQFIEGRITNRLASSFLDVPDDIETSKFVHRFIKEQESYFLINNSEVSLAASAKYSMEAVSLLNQLLSEIRSETTKTRINFLDELIAVLRVANIPHDIMATGDHFKDVVLEENDTIFPSKVYVRAYVGEEINKEIEKLSTIQPSLKNTSKKVLLCRRVSKGEKIYAETIGVTVREFSSFFTDLMRAKNSTRLHLGSSGARNLVSALHIQDYFIMPDASPTRPGDTMEFEFFRTRQKADQEIRNFLEASDHQGILFILGGYGSGKSSLCADVLRRPHYYGSNYDPVLVEVRDLEPTDALDDIVEYAASAAASYDPHNQTPLIILDGLDEHPSAMESKKRRSNMIQLLSAASRTSKLIVTARTSYFRGMEDFWSLFRRENDSDLWNDVAGFIPRTKFRPSVSAIILREFDTDQVESFLNSWDQSKEREASTFKDLLKFDRGRNLISLAQNPLFLFLLANSRPWEREQANCSADVAEVFIRYWLERDVEKGSSRWNLTSTDRLTFCSFLAWKLFQRGMHSLTFEEFDAEVANFFSDRFAGSTNYSLSLDLQTTGIFTGVGSSIQFSTPIFFDFLVTRYFCEDTADHGSRPLSLEQALLWLGKLEVGGGWSLDNLVGIRKPEQVLEDWRVEDPFKTEHIGATSINPIITSEVPLAGVVYFPNIEEGSWVKVNNGNHNERHLLLATWLHHQRDQASGTRLMFANLRGLHARGSAKLVEHYEQWCEDIGFKGELVLSAGGFECSPDSIMGMLMLACGRFSVVVFKFNGAKKDEIALFMSGIGAVPVEGVDEAWITFLGEDGMSPQDTIEFLYSRPQLRHAFSDL